MTPHHNNPLGLERALGYKYGAPGTRDEVTCQTKN